MLLQRFGNLERAPGRFLHAATENQRHSIARRQPDQLFVGRFPAPARSRARSRSADSAVLSALLLRAWSNRQCR
jgi:hypothetical protein